MGMRSRPEHRGDMTSPSTSTPATTPSSRSWRVARLTAPLTRRVAGRRFFPLWAVVHHRGRRSGRDLSVPVAVRASGEGLLIVLPWGPTTNWVRNVVAAGSCTVSWRGVEHRCVDPQILDRPAARPFFGHATWFVVQRLLGAQAFLQLRRTGSASNAAPHGDPGQPGDD